jgi:hypothetical protein
MRIWERTQSIQTVKPRVTEDAEPVYWKGEIRENALKGAIKSQRRKLHVGKRKYKELWMNLRNKIMCSMPLPSWFVCSIQQSLKIIEVNA